jgi:NAD(P)H-dependent FMN reductase
MKLGIIVGTVRQNRVSGGQAKWVANTAAKHDNVAVTVIDLLDYKLPLFDEPVSPRYNPSRDIHPEVQKFLDVVAEQDAYIVITPEYNHSMPGALKNAFDYMDTQLNRKPAAIVSHGTVGGARAAMHLKEVLSEGKALPIPNFVAVLMSDLANENGEVSEAVLANPYGVQTALDGTIAELKWTSDALAAARL